MFVYPQYSLSELLRKTSWLLKELLPITSFYEAYNSQNN